MPFLLTDLLLVACLAAWVAGIGVLSTLPVNRWSRQSRVSFFDLGVTHVTGPTDV